MQGWGKTIVFMLILLVVTLSAGAQTVALTFDDLPETGDLPPNLTRAQVGSRIIRALRAADVPPVYGFVNAGTLDDPDVAHVLERWRQAGFLLGNHTFTHLNPDETPLPVYEKDILRNEPTLRRLMRGQDWHWFRYPYLAEGSTPERRKAIRSFLHDHGYRIAEVTIDFEDHAFNDPYARCVTRHDQASIARMKVMYVDAAKESIRVARLRSQILFGRDISHVMLLHFGGFETVMLPELLKILKEEGLRLVTLPEAEDDPVYSKDPGTINDGGTFLEDFMQSSEFDDILLKESPVAELDRMCGSRKGRR
jgi:peptidoglycan/xylan/chitin deacetylase (PgdA/CDA1 family)